MKISKNFQPNRHWTMSGLWKITMFWHQRKLIQSFWFWLKFLLVRRSDLNELINRCHVSSFFYHGRSIVNGKNRHRSKWIKSCNFRSLLNWYRPVAVSSYFWFIGLVSLLAKLFKASVICERIVAILSRTWRSSVSSWWLATVTHISSRVWCIAAKICRWLLPEHTVLSGRKGGSDKPHWGASRLWCPSG